MSQATLCMHINGQRTSAVTKVITFGRIASIDGSFLAAIHGCMAQSCPQVSVIFI